MTSFTTEGTPLIRYRVGDRIKLDLDSNGCECGSYFPIVESIEGRSSDYILTPSHGKVNLGNISNATKDVQGIIKFQVIQNDLEKVEVLVLATEQYNQSQQNKFIKALAQRLGEEVYINHNIVNFIPNEKSGKFRIVKNNLK